MADQNITDLLDQVIARYQPGGDYGKAALGTLETRKKKTLASQKQSLVSSGLSGTTRGAGLGKKFEEDIGTPTRLGIEETRVGALTQAMQAKAGFMERDQARQDQLMRDAYERYAQQQQQLRSNQDELYRRNRQNKIDAGLYEPFGGDRRGDRGGDSGTPSMPPDPWGSYQGGDTTGGVPGSTQEAVQGLQYTQGQIEGIAGGGAPGAPGAGGGADPRKDAPKTASEANAFTKWARQNGIQLNTGQPLPAGTYTKWRQSISGGESANASITETLPFRSFQ